MPDRAPLARELIALAHTVTLMSPAYVKRNDPEALCAVVTLPSMGFVLVKDAEISERHQVSDRHFHDKAKPEKHGFFHTGSRPPEEVSSLDLLAADQPWLKRGVFEAL